MHLNMNTQSRPAFDIDRPTSANSRPRDRRNTFKPPVAKCRSETHRAIVIEPVSDQYGAPPHDLQRKDGSYCRLHSDIARGPE